jgi:hypothetical protein
MIGQTFQHKHNPNLSCVVTAETKKGYQVKQSEHKRSKARVKTIQTYYYKVDFDKDKGLWEPKKLQ